MELNKNGSEGVRGNGEFTVDEPIFYRINDDNAGPELLMEVCMERGWRCWEGKDYSSSSEENVQHQWQLWWRHSFPGIVYRRLKHNQIVNHIARANGLCRKDVLARTLHKMRHAFPQAFDFSPATFLLPGEYTKLVAEYTRILYNKKSGKSTNSYAAEEQMINSSPRNLDQSFESLNIWICKPTGSSQGKGISIFQDLHELSYCGSAVVQRYLEHPLLVGGYKCDIRLYVLVTSFIPLSIYVYTEGIVRFGTEKYNLEVLDNQYSHLTNTSINKTSPGYKLEKNRVGTGCKWTLRQLRRHFRANSQRDWLLWQKINVIISLTLMSQVGRSAYNNHGPYGSNADASRHGTCFELYGFDILVDDHLTPWLLEVNRCPSLSYDCDVDRVVKKPLLHHLFDLVGPPKVSQPIERPLKMTNQSESHTGMSKFKEMNRLGEKHFDKGKRSSVCEDCDEAVNRITDTEELCSAGNISLHPKLARLKTGLNASRSVHSSPQKLKHYLSSIGSYDGSMTKKSTSVSYARTGHTRRRRSVASLKDELSGLSVAEEISRDSYVPLNCNSSFYRLRRQLMTDYSIAGRYGTLGSVWGSLSSLENVGKPLSFHQDGRPQHKQPSKCGDWVRTFPFNASTLHSSRNPLYIKNIVAELLKYRRTCEKIVKENPSADDESLDNLVKKLLWGDHVLWTPKKG